MTIQYPTTAWRKWGITPLAAVVARARLMAHHTPRVPLAWDQQTDAIKAGYIIAAHEEFKRGQS